MIEKYHGQVELQCDECGEGFGPYPNADFDVLIKDAKSAGWKIFKDNDTWTHHCESCR